MVAELFEVGTHFANIGTRFQRHAFNAIHPNLDSLKSLFDGCKSRIHLFAKRVNPFQDSFDIQLCRSFFAHQGRVYATVVSGATAGLTRVV